MKIRILQGSGPSVAVEGRSFTIQIDGDGKTNLCRVVAVEGGNVLKRYPLSSVFGDRDEARLAWGNGFDVSDPREPTVNLVINQLFAERLAERV